MYQELELWKAEQAKKKENESNNPATSLVSDYDWTEFDKWMADLIKRNGTTKIQPLCHVIMSYYNYNVNTTIIG